jgi:hypothetical protein
MKCAVKCIVRPAVGLGQILKVFNTAALISMKCGVKCFGRPAVGLRQIFEINFINTEGVRRVKCGVKFVRPAVGLRQILTIL